MPDKAGPMNTDSPPFDFDAWLSWLGDRAQAGAAGAGDFWNTHVAPVVSVVPAWWAGVVVVVLVGGWLVSR